MRIIAPKHWNYQILIAILLGLVCLNYSCTNSKKQDNPNIVTKSQSDKLTVRCTGMDSIKLSAIPEKMQQFVSEKKIAGAVTLVAHNGQITSFEAIGHQDIENNIPMQRNTLFRLASMSKPFAAAAIMMLADAGELQLDDPVEKYLPAFQDIWLVSQSDADKRILVKPDRKVTIRDILAHTDGLDALPSALSVKSIAEYSLVISQRALLFEPGSEWRYGGSGITAAARIVEVLSGQPYEDFLRERVFMPLGMENTSFSFSKETIDRVASLYQPSADSGIEKIDAPNWWEFPRPEGGLISTAADMWRWMQTILNGGIFNDTRILSKKSVEEMIKIQTGELKTGFTEGMSFGLGFGIVHYPAGVTSMLSEGTFGHGGAFGTQYWADPANNTIYILMIQRKGFGNGDDSDIRKAFQEIASAAIIDQAIK